MQAKQLEAQSEMLDSLAFSVHGEVFKSASVVLIGKVLRLTQFGGHFSCDPYSDWQVGDGTSAGTQQAGARQEADGGRHDRLDQDLLA